VGEVTVDLSKVKTFSTAQPVQLHVGDKTVLSGPVSPGERAPGRDNNDWRFLAGIGWTF